MAVEGETLWPLTATQPALRLNPQGRPAASGKQLRDEGEPDELQEGRRMNSSEPVGTIGALWRFPVKSMLGEELDAVVVVLAVS